MTTYFTSIWGYLGQYWDKVTSATADTAAWFKSVGNAVAGAVGQVIYKIFQPLLDILLIIGYGIQVIINLVGSIVLIPLWFFNFSVGFLNYIFDHAGDITARQSNYWDTGAIHYLNSIPFFNNIITIISIGLITYMLTYVVRLFQK